MTATAAPRVSVLLAVHNGADYLPAAIDSILGQTFTDFELLIVDDASTDATPSVIGACRDPRVRVVRNDTNLGLTRSLNRGLALARGALVARQDADDVSHRERLGKQARFLDAHPEVAVLGAQARYIDGRGRTTGASPWPKSTGALAIRWQLLFDGPFIHSSVMFRTAVVRDTLGGYDERFVTSQDFELWSRVGARGLEMRNLPDTLVDFRLHGQSASAGYALDGINRVTPVIKDNIARELGAGAVPPAWPDAWIRLTNPRVFPDSGDEWRTAASAIAALHRAFVAKYAEARHDAEIRRHLSSLFIRVAQWGAARRRIGSIACFATAARLDAGLALRMLPRYGGQWLLGPRRRGPRLVPAPAPRIKDE